MGRDLERQLGKYVEWERKLTYWMIEKEGKIVDPLVIRDVCPGEDQLIPVIECNLFSIQTDIEL